MDCIENFEKYLDKKGMRHTTERKKIYEFVRRRKDHFDAEKLFDNMKTKDINVSRASVYRTIPILIDAGIIRESIHKDGRSIYENSCNALHHDHLVCSKCGLIYEFHNDTIEEIQERIANEYGFKMTEHKLVIQGICKKCR
ncbi:MAG: Fur family transcriptional regulator [Candidatus Goldiibacteriota bacterium]